MAKEILPFQKKLSLTFFSFIFLFLLVYLSQNLDLNEKLTLFEKNKFLISSNEELIDFIHTFSIFLI